MRNWLIAVGSGEEGGIMNEIEAATFDFGGNLRIYDNIELKFQQV